MHQKSRGANQTDGAAHEFCWRYDAICGIIGCNDVGRGLRWFSFDIQNAIQTGMEFEKQMSKVKAISGGTASEVAKLKEQAKSSVQPLSLQQVRRRMHRAF